MSKDPPEVPSPADPKAAAPGSSGLQEDTDNMNLFASVWVKIEVNDDDDEIQNMNEKPTHPTKNTKKHRRKRQPYKRLDPDFKHLKCDQCSYKTSYKNCLAIHILGHTNDKPFTCSQCDYKTRYPVSLKRHIFVKHDHFETTKEELSIYKCSVCSYETHFKWNLSSHQRKHDLAKQFKCPQCSYSTAYKHNIIKHSRTHNKPEESTYYCDKCPFATKYEGHISRHLAKVHFEVSEKASRCEHCSFSTKTGWRLNIHRKRSHQEKSVKCTHCNYESMYRCAFKEHKLTHTTRNQNNQINQQWIESLFTTKTCLKIQNTQVTKKEQDFEMTKMTKIRSQMEIDAHNNLADSTKIYDELKSKSNEDPSYYTLNFKDRSNQSLPNISQQSEHERNNHYLVDPSCEVSWSNIQVIESLNQDRPFQCVSCDYTSKFKASVQRHYQRHHTSQNRPYKCVNCDFSTKTKDQIALHNKRSKSDEILVCKTCAFTSVFKCQFVMHEREHYPFKCVHCEYTCKKKPDMQKHFTIVHLGNGLKCSHCDFRAIRKESLLCHEVIHTGKKPFQCELCEYASVRRSLLENHMNRFHKMKMVEKIIDDSKIESLKRKTVVNDCDTVQDYFTTGSVTSVSN